LKCTWFRLIPVIIGAVVVIGGVGAIAASKSGNKSSTKSPSSVTATQTLPVKSNPIQNSSTVEGLVIAEIAVQDNVDPATKKAIDDRLQINIKNTSAKTMSNLEAYYSMKDSTTGQVENYYQKLTGL
jgi:hypothetical protein